MSLSLVSQYIYLGTKSVVAHKLCMSSLLVPSKLLNGCFPPLEQFVTWYFAKSERRGSSVKPELELQDRLPRNPGCFLSFLWFAEVRVCRKLPYAQKSILFPLGPSVLTAICTSARCESFSWGEEDASPSASSRWKSLSSLFLGSESAAHTLTLLRHLNYSYSIRHIWRKEIGLSQVSDVAAGVYDWKLIPWHRLMKPAIPWDTEMYFIFLITHDL